MALATNRVGDRASAGRSFFPGIETVENVSLEPFHLDLQLEQAVAQLVPAMPFTRSHIQVGRQAVGLERAIHLHRLRQRYAGVLFADKK